mgnify:FL=1
MGFVNNENVKKVVRYQAPTPEMIEAHENLACAAETMIETILRNVPECADRTAAIRHVREAKMTASDGVALEGLI